MSQEELSVTVNVTMDATENPGINVTFGEELDYQMPQLALAIFTNVWMALSIVLILLLNPVLLLTLPRVTSIQPTTKTLMASLTVSDLCAGFLGILKLQESVAGAWLLGDFLCAAYGVTGYAFRGLGILSLLLLTLDRYGAISRPLRYPALVTSFRTNVTVGITWAATFIACILMYGVYDRQTVLPGPPQLCTWESYNWTVYVAFLVIILVTAIICALYVHVLLIARRHARRIATENQAGNGQRMPRPQTTKTTTTIVIITGTLFLTCIPASGILAVLSSEDSFRAYEGLAIDVTETLFMSNGWLNVAIYYLRNRDFRHALHRSLSDLRNRAVQRLLH